MSNVEVRHSARRELRVERSFLLKRLSKAKPHFDILRFDIRYSAVRCLINLNHRNSQFDPMGDNNLKSKFKLKSGGKDDG